MIKEKDNVSTALRYIDRNESSIVGIDGYSREIVAQENVPTGHKFAVISSVIRGSTN